MLGGSCAGGGVPAGFWCFCGGERFLKLSQVGTSEPHRWPCGGRKPQPLSCAEQRSPEIWRFKVQRLGEKEIINRKQLCNLGRRHGGGETGPPHTLPDPRPGDEPGPRTGQGRGSCQQDEAGIFLGELREELEEPRKSPFLLRSPTAWSPVQKSRAPVKVWGGFPLPPRAAEPPAQGPEPLSPVDYFPLKSPKLAGEAGAPQPLNEGPFTFFKILIRALLH